MPITLNASTASGLVVTPDNSGVIAFQNNGTTELTVNAFGIGLGTAVPSSGTGITFPAVQDPSSNANTLDDYEEGTWTPVFGVPCGFNIGTINAAYYTKIGNVVTAQCYITLNGVGNSSQIFLDGLPFVAKVGGYWTSSLDMGIGGVLGTYVRVNAGSTECVFLYSGGGTSGSTTTARQTLLANQCGANYIIFSVTYFT